MFNRVYGLRCTLFRMKYEDRKDFRKDISSPILKDRTPIDQDDPNEVEIRCVSLHA